MDLVSLLELSFIVLSGSDRLTLPSLGIDMETPGG